MSTDCSEMKIISDASSFKLSDDFEGLSSRKPRRRIAKIRIVSGPGAPGMKTRHQTDKADAVASSLILECWVCSATFVSDVRAYLNHFRKSHRLQLQTARPFLCSRCPLQKQKFTTLEELHHHLLASHSVALNSVIEKLVFAKIPLGRSATFECPVCPKKFEGTFSHENYERHSQEEHLPLEVKPYHCPNLDCKKRFPFYRSLMAHYVADEDCRTVWQYDCFADRVPIESAFRGFQSSYTCHWCFQVFATALDFGLHTKVHPGYHPFCCTFCDQLAISLTALRIHQTENHVLSFTCETCGDAYPTRTLLDAHLAEIHELVSLLPDVSYTSGKGPFRCCFCPENEFQDVTEFGRHAKHHEAYLPFSCSECLEKFCDFESLSLHYGQSHGLFPCAHCEEVSPSDAKAGEHVEDCHRNQKKFIPEIEVEIEEAISSEVEVGVVEDGMRDMDDEDELGSNESGDEDEKMNGEGCKDEEGAKQTEESELAHRQKEAPLSRVRRQNKTCGMCGVRFANHRKFAVHVSENHPDYKPFTCNLCGSHFANVKNMRKHQNRRHLRALRCNLCCDRFLNTKDRQQHYIEAHSSKDKVVGPAVEDYSYFFYSSRRRVYECHVCARAFESPRQFACHAVSHNGYVPFRCSMCGQRFLSFYQFRSHRQKVHFPRFTCTFGSSSSLRIRGSRGACGIKFKDQKSLDAHMKHHADEVFADEEEEEEGGNVAEEERDGLKAATDSLVCSEKLFVVSEEAEKMLKVEPLELIEEQAPLDVPAFYGTTVLSVYTCAKCGKAFDDPLPFTKHIRLHKGYCPFRCGVCGAQYKSLKLLLRHRGKSHTGESMEACKICDAVVKRKSLRGHMTTHSPAVDSFICSKCGKVLHRKRTWRRHELDCEPQRDKEYPCQICARPCPTSSAAKHHEKTHRPPILRPFVCHVCGEGYQTKAYLQQHLIIHEGAKSYECSVCGRKFNIQSYLRQHMRLHTGEKPYKCVDCGQAFAQRAGLLIHRRNHHHGMPGKKVGVRKYVKSAQDEDLNVVGGEGGLTAAFSDNSCSGDAIRGNVGLAFSTFTPGIMRFGFT